MIICFGSVVVSVWFCDEELGCCSSLTMFSLIIKFPKLLLLPSFPSSDVKISEIFACFEMVSFIFFFSLLFWALDLYLNVDTLLKRRNFIPDSNNSLLELFYSMRLEMNDFLVHKRKMKLICSFYLFESQISDQRSDQDCYFNIRINWPDK